MSSRAPTVLALSALAIVCNQTTAPSGAEPVLLTVNGATHPAVLPGERAGWAGVGFGSAVRPESLLVTADGALRAGVRGGVELPTSRLSGDHAWRSSAPVNVFSIT